MFLAMLLAFFKGILGGRTPLRVYLRGHALGQRRLVLVLLLLACSGLTLLRLPRERLLWGGAVAFLFLALLELLLTRLTVTADLFR